MTNHRIVALAGRRIDSPDEKTARFPLSNASLVHRRIEGTFTQLAVRRLVCSAACGADLIGLAAARRLGIRSRVVLPFGSSRFREVSVMDRPAHAEWNWGRLFDELVEEARARGDVIELTARVSEAASFNSANQVILEEALRLRASERDVAGLPATAIVVWDGAARGENDFTAAFLEAARRRNFHTMQLCTLEHCRANLFDNDSSFS